MHAPSSALPIGASHAVGDTQLVEIDPNLPRSTPMLLNAVLALLQADDDTEEEEVMRSPVLGYIHMSVYCLYFFRSCDFTDIYHFGVRISQFCCRCKS
jgi:hypothetical protein